MLCFIVSVLSYSEFYLTNYVIPDNFRIQEKRNRLLSQIEEVRRTRALQRSARKRHGSSYDQGLATVAVVGYTNAASGFTIELCHASIELTCI